MRAVQRMWTLVRRGIALLALAPIWVYRRVISPVTPSTCRYYPSCSAYAEQAVKTHGALRGSWLALRRLARCHPWTPGGVDHVPPARHAPVVPTRGSIPDPIPGPVVDRVADRAPAPASPVTGA